MDSRELMMDQFERRYSIVDCTIVNHVRYGLIIELDSGTRGYVDWADIADEPLSVEEWPRIGSRLRGVVLSHTRDGRVVLSARNRDLMLMQSVIDPSGAMEEWRAIKSADMGNIAFRVRFYQSPNALPLLRWALSSPVEREYAEKLLATAPSHLKSKLSSTE